MASANFRAALDKIAHEFPLKRAAWAAFPWSWTDRLGEYDPTERLLSDDRQDARMDGEREAEFRREENGK